MTALFHPGMETVKTSMEVMVGVLEESQLLTQNVGMGVVTQVVTFLGEAAGDPWEAPRFNRDHPKTPLDNKHAWSHGPSSIIGPFRGGLLLPCSRWDSGAGFIDSLHGLWEPLQ